MDVVAAWQDREVQPEERKGTLRRDRLERLLWLTPQGGKGKREERCGEAERRRGNGEAVDGGAWAHGLDARRGTQFSSTRYAKGAC